MACKKLIISSQRRYAHEPGRVALRHFCISDIETLTVDYTQHRRWSLLNHKTQFEYAHFAVNLLIFCLEE